MLNPAEFVSFYAQIGIKKTASGVRRTLLLEVLAGFFHRVGLCRCEYRGAYAGQCRRQPDGLRIAFPVSFVKRETNLRAYPKIKANVIK